MSDTNKGPHQQLKKETDLLMSVIKDLVTSKKITHSAVINASFNIVTDTLANLPRRERNLNLVELKKLIKAKRANKQALKDA